MVIKILLLSITFSLATSTTFAKASKSKASEKMNTMLENLGKDNVVIKGKFRKFDKKFIYLSRRNVRRLVKVDRRFFTNSPQNYKKNQTVRVELPLARLLLDNQRSPSSKTR